MPAEPSPAAPVPVPDPVPAPVPERRVSFLFVIDGPGLEAMSLLLAATLRRHHPQAALIAYASARSRDALAPLTRRVHDRLGVEIRPFDVAQGFWKKDYPHGNKLFACADRRDGDLAVFLDTDVVCVAPLPLGALTPGQVAAVPEGVASWGKDGDRWERAYAHVGLPLPEDRVTLTRGRKRAFWPYFNAGLVAFPEAEIAPGLTFGEAWLATARDFDWNCKVAQKRPWLDQITLPLTIKAHGLGYEALPDTWNFSLSDREKVGRARKSFVLHYHRRRYLDLAPGGSEAVQDLAAVLDDPARELPGILAAIGPSAQEVATDGA